MKIRIMVSTIKNLLITNTPKAMYRSQKPKKISYYFLKQNHVFLNKAINTVTELEASSNLLSPTALAPSFRIRLVHFHHGSFSSHLELRTIRSDHNRGIISSPTYHLEILSLNIFQRHCAVHSIKIHGFPTFLVMDRCVQFNEVVVNSVSQRLVFR